MRSGLVAILIALHLAAFAGAPPGKAAVAEEAAKAKEAGEAEYRAGNYDKALEHFARAKPLLEKTGEAKALAAVLLIEGKISETTGDLEGSMMLYQKALAICEKAEAPPCAGNALSRIADLLVYKGEFEKALGDYETATAIFRGAGDAEGTASALHGIGIAHTYLGRYKEAEEEYTEALKICVETGSKGRQVAIRLSLGELYTFSGRLSSAHRLYEETALLMENMDYPLGRAVLYIKWGIVCQSTGESGKALRLFKKALDLLRGSPHEFYQGMACGSMASVYNAVGLTEEAKKCLEEALVHYEKANGPAGMANVHEQLGRLYFERLGDNEKALEMIEKAIPLHESTNNAWGVSSSRVEKGRILLAAGRKDEAGREFGSALETAEKVGSKAFMAYACIELSRLRFQEGDSDGAIRLVDKAIEYCAEMDYLAGVTEGTFARAGYLAKAGKAAEAVDEYERSLSLMEKERRGAAAPEMQGSYLKSVAAGYREAASFMLENGYADNAFKVAESLKARQFLDRLAEGLVDVEKGLPPEIKSRRDDLLGKIDSLRSRLVYLPPEEGGEGDTIRKDLERAERELGELTLEIRTESPAYASVHYPEPASAAEIGGSVLRSGEVMVEYFVGDEKVWAFVLAPGKKLEAIPLPVERRRLEATLRSYLHAVSRPDGLDATGVETGLRLNGWLIEPLERLLPGKAELVLVTDGAISMLPFETLVTGRTAFRGRPRFLIERRRIKYIQSASVLKLMRRVPVGTSPGKGFAGFGDPVYGEGLESLPGSAREVEAIAGLFGGRKLESALFLKGDAREERAKSQEMGRFGFIHFACHGLLEKKRQCLALSIPAEGSPEDGFLNLGELMNCRYDARLVSLSACETGLGDYEAGEGVTGLTRAALYAGSRAVVASLWSVDDEGTRELMVGFYNRALADGGADLSSALRSAKLDMLRGRRGAPFYWGAFVIYGE